MVDLTDPARPLPKWMPSPATHGSTDRSTWFRAGFRAASSLVVDREFAARVSVETLAGETVPAAVTFSGADFQVASTRELERGTSLRLSIPATLSVDFEFVRSDEPMVLEYSTGRAVSSVPIRLSSSGTSLVGDEVVLAARAEGVAGRWSFDFGDGSAPTRFTGDPVAFHVFDEPGIHRVTVRFEHDGRVDEAVLDQAVVRPETPDAPTKASTVIYDPERRRVWCVNPDNNTVSCVDHVAGRLLVEVPVGVEPRSVALAADRSLWVTNEESWSITILDADSGEVTETLELPFACRPFGVAHSSDGTTYVTTLGTREILRYDTATHELIGRIEAGGPLRGLAVSGDGSRILATRFISPAENGEVIVASPGSFDGSEPALAHSLVEDPGPDTLFSGRGVPNHVTDVAITPDGRRAWIPSKKDNTSRGLWRDGQPLNFFNTVRPMSAVVDVATGREVLEDRIDYGARDFPVAVAFSPRGAYAFVAMRGSKTVEVVDTESATRLFSIEETGIAPIGVCVDPDQQLLVVHNFLTRDLATYDIAPLLDGRSWDLPLVSRVRSVTVEILRGIVLPGKQIFHTAADPRMSRLGHMSCASCHFDSGSDGRIWDFTDRGEGLRNTISLMGRQGTGQGLVHWSANFNEIQDFEQDIRFGQGGTGFLSDSLFAASADALGYDKNQLGFETDAINGYVSTFDKFPPSPYRNQDGSMTAAGQRGRQVFERLECWQCHGGRTFTDFQFGTVHDIGTIQPHSGSRIGDHLRGIDTPTLRGIWETAPYFHDGSAATLMDVLEREGLKGSHGETAGLSQQEKQDLVAYLLQIDGLERPARNAVHQPDAIVAFESLVQRAGIEDSFVLTAHDWPVERPQVAPGVRVRADSAEVFTEVPEGLRYAYRMKSAAADADESAGTESPLVELTLRHDATITIGLDARASSVPSWLGEWSELEARIATDLTTYRLFEKRFEAGAELSLGANPQKGLATYLVLIQR
ncbi:MAG: c-type cytochrome [Planctomycetota bacterium]